MMSSQIDYRALSHKHIEHSVYKVVEIYSRENGQVSSLQKKKLTANDCWRFTSLSSRIVDNSRILNYLTSNI